MLFNYAYSYQFSDYSTTLEPYVYNYSNDWLDFCYWNDIVHEPGRSLENKTTELLGTCKCEAATAPSAPAQPTSRFAAPVSDTTVAKARIDSVPKKTREDSAYCMRFWQEWARNRLQAANLRVPPFSELDKQGLQYWLSRFILEIRTKKRHRVCSKHTASHCVWNYATLAS